MTLREFVAKKKITAANASQRTSKSGNEGVTIKCFLAKGGELYVDCYTSGAIDAFKEAGWRVSKMLDSVYVTSNTDKDGREMYFGEVVEMLG